MYFNENDSYAAAWPANLFPEATVDRRSIADVQPDEVSEFRRCHFFGGIGGWELALRLAGFPDDREVWTGSCPCQPYSTAGKQKGDADERNLWPAWFTLIRKRHPECVFGEQVGAAIGKGWLDRVFADLETEGYACGAIVLGAHSVGAPHKRQRLFWVADARSSSTRRHPISGSNSATLGGIKAERSGEEATQSTGSRTTVRLADSEHSGREGWNTQRDRSDSAMSSSQIGTLEHATSDGRQQRRPGSEGGSVIVGCGIGGMADSDGERLPASRRTDVGGRSAWSDAARVHCLDGKARRAQSGLQLLVDGVPVRVADGSTVDGASRVGMLKGFGNAIVPQLAAEFVKAFLESI